MELANMYVNDYMVLLRYRSYGAMLIEDIQCKCATQQLSN